MSCACGCCEGTRAVTPVAIFNRPGLDTIRTRIGTHARFLETMRARLSSADFPELAELRTRDPSDPSIALLDAWAIVADVLCLYQERIANEGYLRTATERRSLVELARLIGYAPRPGVAASVYLAFGLEKDSAPVVIPKGTKSNSIPGPGETMQTFETSEALPARFEWGAIRPRLSQPQTEPLIRHDGLYLKGTATKLKPGDMLLIRWSVQSGYEPIRVTGIDADHAADRTLVGLAFPPPDRPTPQASFTTLDQASFAALLRPQSSTPIGRAQMPRSIGSSFAPGADTVPQLLANFQPALSQTLYAALRNAAPRVAQPIEVHAMRIEARPFGHNAPLKLDAVGNEKVPPSFVEWSLTSADNTVHRPNRIALDGDYAVADDTLVVIEKPPLSGDLLASAQKQGLPTTPPPIVLPVLDAVVHGSSAAFGMTSKTLLLSWQNQPWLSFADKNEPEDKFDVIRGSRIYLGSEQLALADAPIAQDVGGVTIELDGLYEGLDPGRWLIVEGERTDIPDGDGNPIPGIRAAELVMLAGVEQTIRMVEPEASPASQQQPGGIGNGDQKEGATDTGPVPPTSTPQPGDTCHSIITLAAGAAGSAGLSYTYKRGTVVIHGNVAHATHGETRTETLGSGNAATAFQRFLLRQPPLTFVSARTPSGIASTLEVRVNDVLWREAPSLVLLGPADRKYTTQTGDDDKTATTFGNGRRGMRLPTGQENVKARYRSGIGAPGNVKARQISLLGSRPLGLKDVINPLRASGGADREAARDIRRNAPIAIMALDRLLSTTDYADFARNFGGVGKASAERIRNDVEVVIAGVDDAPIDESSDVFVNLKDALNRFGDPAVRVTLAVRERWTLIVHAGVRIDPDYLWEHVEPRIRAAMLDTFSFQNQQLGEPVFLSHALRAIQRVRGVVSVDIDVFDWVSSEQLTGSDRAFTLADTLTTAKQRLSPKNHQIAYLPPKVADTLILQELPS